MTPMEIARRLAALGQTQEAQSAFALALAQSEDPAGQLEAAVYILQTGGDYKISYTCFRDLYNRGQFREETLDLMTRAFYEPNVQDLQSRYERNCRLLKNYPYLFRKDFPAFRDLPIRFYPFDEEGYVPFYPAQERFGDYVNPKIPAVRQKFFQNLENPVLASGVYNQYELEYLHDNVRRSEDIGRENHVYLHYGQWEIFCAYLQCLDFRPLLKERKLVFLMGEELSRYPLDFQAEFGVNYSRSSPRPVAIREINRLIWHTQYSAHNGGDFFNEVFDAHPNLLALPSLMLSEVHEALARMEVQMNGAKSLRQALERFSNWRDPRRVEELYRMKGRTWKDFLVGVYLQDENAAAGLDPASRIVPAVFFQPHFPRIRCGLELHAERGEAVFISEDLEAVQASPLFRAFRYVKTFTPLRRVTTSYGASVRFMRQSADWTARQGVREEAGTAWVAGDLLSERLFNRGYLVDPEDRLFKDSVLVRFEDAKLNPKATFTALAAFLDLPYTESMTRCTLGGKEFYTPGNARGFDPETVYRTYEEYVDGPERAFLEYCFRDVYETYGYDFQNYDGKPLDVAGLEALLEGCALTSYHTREAWKNVFGEDSRLTRQGVLVPPKEDGTPGEGLTLEEYVASFRERRLARGQALQAGLRLVSRENRPLEMMRKLEPDPALLEQPLYH